jgi:predicted transposase/invertase (TIGR01784 family)
MTIETATNKGIKQGRAEEHEKVIRSARAMKSAGMSLDTIKESTGLTEEEIMAL